MCKCLLVASEWLEAAMTSDFEDDIVHDEDAICGWGADDMDDELLGHSRRKVDSQIVTKGTKRRSQETLVNSNSGAELSKLVKPPEQQHRSRLAAPSTEKQTRGTNLLPMASHNVESSLGNQPPARRKSKRKQIHEILKDHHEDIPKPSPRTTSILEENAAIAALGRQRRMKVVASAMAANIPRKAAMASVVSASFDDVSDDDQEEREISYRQRSDEWLPSSAPQDEPDKLPRLVEPSTAPAGLTEVPKKTHPPQPLPLLCISPDYSGDETRLAGRDEPALKAPRHRQHRRHRQQKTSLLPSRDVSDVWESNFHPFQRCGHSLSIDQVSSSDASTSGVASSFTGGGQVCEVPIQTHDLALRANELLPSIHQPNRELASAIATEVSNSSHGSKSKPREEEESGEDDDESWTHVYDDPEVIAKSMAGLIQALSTFAAGGKNSKASKGGKNKKRRAKVQQLQHFSHNILVSPPSPREINTSLIHKGHRKPDPNVKRRKHRKLRNKTNDDSSHSIVNRFS